MPSKDLTQPCTVCADAESSLFIRNRRLCKDCFIYYVTGKFVKRLESYRGVRKSNEEQIRKVLVPVSGGVSSLVLLHLLDRQLRKQTERRLRPAYELHILIVESPLLESGPPSNLLAALQKQYPSHTYSHIDLSQISELDPTALDSASEAERSSANENDAAVPDNPLDVLLKSNPSPTARADILEVLLTKVIVAFAKRENIETLFWGHSDTRLAAKTLSSVAKGRGSGIPFQLLDGPTPWEVTFHFPARELYKAELELFADIDDALPSELVIQDMQPEKVVSTRNLSIDQLITNYINSQGEKYPSIMANVVRTAGKLRAPAFSADTPRCIMCGLLVENQHEGHDTPTMCYGCSRSSEINLS